MGFGIFGKVTAKRDFVSRNIPRELLQPFETWLHSSIAHSQNQVGRNWPDYYLVAPIWRFWLGADILGMPCQGVIMSSVDKVGRYFPFTILYYGEEGQKICPPIIEPLNNWYASLEQTALMTLSEEEYDVANLTSHLNPPVMPGPEFRSIIHTDRTGSNWLPSPYLASPPQPHSLSSAAVVEGGEATDQTGEESQTSEASVPPVETGKNLPSETAEDEPSGIKAGSTPLATLGEELKAQILSTSGTDAASNASEEPEETDDPNEDVKETAQQVQEEDQSETDMPSEKDKAEAGQSSNDETESSTTEDTTSEAAPAEPSEEGADPWLVSDMEAFEEPPSDEINFPAAAVTTEPAAPVTLFEDIYEAEFFDAAASRSYWWVVQNDQVVALRCQNGLPDPKFYLQMLGVVPFHPQDITES